ncbi:MAG: YihY/virulence factor BrkB family protein [Acetobacteraceae bacterium]
MEWARAKRLHARFEATWLVRGYRTAEAGDVAAVIAFRALVALVPTILLVVGVAGAVLRGGQVLQTAILATVWALPASGARDGLDAILTARRESAWFGLSSAVGFAWIGASFVSTLARGMNRVYGVPNRHVVHQRLRGFAVVVVFAVLFAVATIAASLPTLFVGRRLSVYFATWSLASWRGQLVSYGLAMTAALLLFGVLHRVVPNAGQELGDVWPGTLVGAMVFLALTQAFPLYLRIAARANVYGAAFGLVWLLVTWFHALAHVLLFSTYVNATHLRRRAGRRGVQSAAPPGGTR